MPLPVITQTYLLPANSRALNAAITILQALGLTYQAPTGYANDGAALVAVTVAVPAIPVVHYYSLQEERQDLLHKLQQRTNRPSHAEAQGWAYGDLAAIYPSTFFNDTARQEINHELADLLTREHVLQHFAAQHITPSRITFSTPPAEALLARRFFRDNDWYALVEEARLVMPELATLLGAVG
jgi:hypothetical protein